MKLIELCEDTRETINGEVTISIHTSVDDDDIYKVVISLRQIGYGGQWMNYTVANSRDREIEPNGKDYSFNVAMGDDFPSWITIHSQQMLNDSRVEQILSMIEGPNAYEEDDWTDDDEDEYE